MAEPSTRLRVRVAPGAQRSELLGRYGDAWKLRVAAPPQAGRANEAVLRLLSERLELSRDRLSLVSGPTSRDKIVRLTGLDRHEAERRLAARSNER